MSSPLVGHQSAAVSLKTKLERGDFVITCEVTPPATADPETVLGLARPLAGIADAVNVTDAASARTQMSALAAAILLKQAGIEPILQLTCRDRNRIALQGELLGAAAFGINNLLLLHGDPPAAGDQPEAKAVYDLTTNELAATATGLSGEGRLPNGRATGGQVDFFIGGADTPVEPTAVWSATRLVAKRNAGMAFIQTQFAMDAALVRRYLARLREEDTLRDLRYLIGIAPLTSAASARWMCRHLPGTIIPDQTIARLENARDPEAEGQRIGLELIEELAVIPGVSGVHIMSPRNHAGMVALAEQARRKGLQATKQSLPASN